MPNQIISGFAVVAIITSEAHAEDLSSDVLFVGLPNGGTTLWSDPANWSTGDVPQPGQNVRITTAFLDPATLVLDVPINLADLTVSNQDGPVFSLVLPVGGSLNCSSEQIGQRIGGESERYSASFVQLGGVNVAMQMVQLGRTATGAGSPHVGVGFYTILGGALETPYLEVGNDGSGFFEQNGGIVHTTGGSIEIATVRYSKGQYTLNAGTLTVEGSEYIAESGTGTFIQNGGVHTVAQTIHLGVTSLSGGGRYFLNGRDASLAVGSIQIGDNSAGTFTQSGGSNTVANVCYVGNFNVGHYELSGGSLTVGQTLNVGNFGDGTFTQTGGSVTVGSPDVAGVLLVGTKYSGYRLSGSTAQLTVLGTETIGKRNNSLSGGNFDQAGGTHVVQHLLDVVFGGSFSLSGGSLQTPWLEVETGSSFTWSGGSLKTRALQVSGSMTLTPGSGRTLDVADYFTLPGGKQDLSDNALIVRYEADSAASTFQQLNAAVRAGEIVGNPDAYYRLAVVDNADLRRGRLGDVSFDPGDVSQILVESTLVGDSNLDGTVDVADLALLASNWQRSGVNWYQGDYNDDGTVNVVDLGELASHWQAEVSLAAAMAELHLTAVPEPGLLGGSAMLLMIRRRRNN